MNHLDSNQLSAGWHADPEIRAFMDALAKGTPYAFRVARAAAYGMASYLLLWLQPHFSFSFSAFALAIFLLAIVKRSLPVAEIAVLLIVASVFIPVRLTQALGSVF